MSVNTQFVLNEFGQRIAKDSFGLSDGTFYIPNVSGWKLSQGTVDGPAIIRYPGISGLKPCPRCKCGSENNNYALIGSKSDWIYNVTSPAGGEITYPSSGQYFAAGIYASGHPDLRIDDTIIVFQYAPSYKPFYSDFHLLEGKSSLGYLSNTSCSVVDNDVNSKVFGDGSFFNVSGTSMGYSIYSGTIPSYNPGGTVSNPQIGYAKLACKIYRYISSGYIHVLATAEGSYPGWSDSMESRFVTFYGKTAIPSGSCGVIDEDINNLVGSTGSTESYYDPYNAAYRDYVVLGTGGRLHIKNSLGSFTDVSCPSSNKCENCCTTPTSFQAYIQSLNCRSKFLFPLDPKFIPFSGSVLNSLYSVPLNDKFNPADNVNKYYCMGSSNDFIGYTSDIYHGGIPAINPRSISGILMSGIFDLNQDPNNNCKWSYKESPSKVIDVYAYYAKSVSISSAVAITSGYKVSGIFDITLERMQPNWYLFKIMYSSDEFTANLFTSYIITKNKKCGLTEDSLLPDRSIGFTDYPFSSPRASNIPSGYGRAYDIKNFNPDYYTNKSNGILGNVEVFLGNISANETLNGAAVRDPTFLAYSTFDTFDPNDPLSLQSLGPDRAGNQFSYRTIQYQKIQLFTCPVSRYDGMTQSDYDGMTQSNYNQLY